MSDKQSMISSKILVESVKFRPENIREFLPEVVRASLHTDCPSSFVWDVMVGVVSFRIETDIPPKGITEEERMVIAHLEWSLRVLFDDLKALEERLLPPHGFVE